MENYALKSFHYLSVLVSFLSLSEVAQSQSVNSFSIRDHNYVVGREFTTENGLPANGTNGMYQDQLGYIWAATYNGLIKYNGLDFKIYNTANLNTLESNRFISVSEDLSGNIWAGLEQGGFLMLNQQTDSTITYTLDKEKFGPNVKTTIFQFTSENTPWIGTSAGVFTIKDREMIFMDHLPNGYVNHMALHEGFLYILYTDRLIKFDPDQSEFQTIAELRDDVIYFNDHSVDQFDNVVQLMDFHFINGDLYLMSEAGLIRYNNEDTVEIIITRMDAEQAALHGFMPDQEIIYVYGRDGIFQFHLPGRELIYYNRVDVIDVMIDHEGSLWAASRSNGIMQFVSTPVFQGVDFDRLDQQGITGILNSSDGSVYVGANCDGVYKFSGNSVQRFGSESGLENECVWSLMEQEDGNIWVGTWGGGVYFKESQNNSFERFRLEGFEEVDVFLSIFEDSNNSIWFGTYSNGLFRYSNSEVKSIRGSDGELLPAVRMIYENGPGEIYVATDGGIGIVQDGQVQEIESISNLDISNFRTITQDPAGRMWFGSYGDGIVITQTGMQPKIATTENGLSDNTISQLSFDMDGDLWLGGNLGVFFIQKSQIKQFLNDEIDQLRVSRLGVTEGMTIRETNGGFMPSSQLMENGNLLIPTVQGVNVINTQRMELNENPPNTYVEHVEIDGEVYRLSQVESISYKAQRIIFRYSGLSYKNPEYNRFEYMLEGFDENWISSGINGEAIYSSIPPGDYIFKVKASNNDGFWSSDVASLSFNIEPPFWQTVWFYLGVLILFGVVITGAFRYRLRSIQKYNRQLEQMVDERTEELSISNKKLKKHIEEKNKLQSILAHDLRNPFSAILGYIELIKSEFEQKGDVEQVEMMNMLLDSGRNTLSLLENLLQWSGSKEGGLETKFEIINVTELVDEAISMTDAQSTFKNILVRNLVDKPYYVWADQNMILSVIRNLISNAIKFSGRDSSVEISLEEKDEKVIVSVEDSGVGIPEEDQDHLFAAEKMQQKVGTQGEKGIGMGLMLCKEFIDKHDEKIWVSSTPKKGSTFSFSLQKATEREKKQVDKSD